MMISGISLALGLVFLFILVVDWPYKGAFSVGSSELAALTHKFDLIDRLSNSGEVVSGRPSVRGTGPG